ncbi:MAG: hypothetical protein O3A00_21770 [Planctomycetota bacterium]|nr:hypothetical protein [Planctomycetota bacterium]
MSATKTSIEPYSFVAYFDLLTGGQSFSLGQIAADFAILRRHEKVPTGPAELVIRYSDRPETRRKVEVLGHDAKEPLLLRIRQLRES